MHASLRSGESAGALLAGGDVVSTIGRRGSSIPGVGRRFPKWFIAAWYSRMAALELPLRRHMVISMENDGWARPCALEHTRVGVFMARGYRGAGGWSSRSCALM